MSRRRRFDLDAYVADVRTLLADEFGWDDFTAEAFTRTATQCLHNHHSFEFTCDNALSARFRLHNNPNGEPLALRLAFHPVTPDWAAGRSRPSPGDERARDVTAKLSDLLASHGVTP